MDLGAAQADLQAGREALLRGDAATAAPLFAAAVDAEPRGFEARYWLASALLLLGDPDGADQILSDARTLHTLSLLEARGMDLARLRTDSSYANDMATELYMEHMIAQASVVWGMAIAAGRGDGSTLANYAVTLQHQGRVEEAAGVYRATAEGFGSPNVHQYLVYAQLFCDDGEARHAAEARAWARLYANVPPPAPHANPPLAGRRLRVGYVAPNFAGTQLRQFMAPVLEAHDPKVVDVVLYPLGAASETGWPRTVAIHPIGHLSDADAAALIRQDGIDILNDCWGYTAGCRMGVFARKPAPVQVAWVNFVQTTGLSQMDHVLHAASDNAPDLSGLFTETLWPVASVFTPFRPAKGRLAPTPTPALAAGRITFGSLNHPAKLGHEAMSAWAAVMRGAPEAQLLLKYRYYVDPVMQRATLAQFAARGVAPERILFEGHSSGKDYYRAFQGLDLMLDSWPVPGSTTTLEALSNGVPVLSMVGEPSSVGGFYARTLLEAVGLHDLATTSPEAFVETALALAADPANLDRIRAQVRPAFDASALRDEAGFTRRLETAFADMFESWRGQGRRTA